MANPLLNISDIRVNGGTQSRAAINKEVVADYAEAMRDGAQFPAIVVFYDGSSYWLADGFHRYEAFARAEKYEVPAEIHQGTQRDAILYSVGANAQHGLRRSSDDKRRAVQVLLNDPEWSSWSNREIARQCGVSDWLVRDLRNSLTASSRSEKRTYTTKHGTQAEMKTENIGVQSKRDQKTVVSESPDILPADGQAEAAQSKHDQEFTEPDDPVEAQLRKDFAALSEDGWADAYVGLMVENMELRDLNKTQAATIRELNSRLKEFDGDQSATIRKLQKQIRHKESEMFRANDKADRAMARAKALEKRVSELESLGMAL
ncbi:ParB N-terminal domain-containing protein [Ponticaulis profundi]|uniref:ParB N-terminal domain-containing protein n=1 Tax=Ponticaulis profundi TaxID=2665222 RepID=A0ABW1S882_9PROT